MAWSFLASFFVSFAEARSNRSASSCARCLRPADERAAHRHHYHRTDRASSSSSDAAGAATAAGAGFCIEGDVSNESALAFSRISLQRHARVTCNTGALAVECYISKYRARQCGRSVPTPTHNKKRHGTTLRAAQRGKVTKKLRTRSACAQNRAAGHVTHDRGSISTPACVECRYSFTKNSFSTSAIISSVASF